MTQQENQITQSVNELVQMVSEGKTMDAFEKFYHDDLEKTDLDGVLIKGKDKSRQIGQDILSKVTAVRDFSKVGIVVKDNRSFLIWSLDFDIDNNPVKVLQVAIQDWQDGKIIRERFFA